MHIEVISRPIPANDYFSIPFPAADAKLHNHLVSTVYGYSVNGLLLPVDIHLYIHWALAYLLSTLSAIKVTGDPGATGPAKRLAERTMMVNSSTSFASHDLVEIEVELEDCLGGDVSI